MRTQIAVLSIGISILAVACGPSSSATLTLSASGISPKTLTVAPGSTITYQNTDSATHQPTSNPHPTHIECPELNGGSIPPGSSNTVTVSPSAKTCGIHDHLNPSSDAFKATINVQ